MATIRGVEKKCPVCHKKYMSDPTNHPLDICPYCHGLKIRGKGALQGLFPPKPGKEREGDKK